MKKLLDILLWMPVVGIPVALYLVWIGTLRSDLNTFRFIGSACWHGATILFLVILSVL